MHTPYDRFRAYKPPKIPSIGRVCQFILFSPSLRSPRQTRVVHTPAPRVSIRRSRPHRTPSLSSTRPIGLCFWVAIRESLLRAPFRCRRFHAVPAPSSPGGRVPKDMWQCVKTTKVKDRSQRRNTNRIEIFTRASRSVSHNHSHVVYLPPIFYLNYLIQRLFATIVCRCLLRGHFLLGGVALWRGE